MIDSFDERSKIIRQLPPGQIRRIYLWLKEHDRKIEVYERVVEDQEPKVVRHLKRAPAVIGY